MGFDIFEIMFFVFMAVGIARVILEIFTGDPDEVITGNTTDWTTGWPTDRTLACLDENNPFCPSNEPFGVMDVIGHPGCAGLPGNAFTTLREEREHRP